MGVLCSRDLLFQVCGDARAKDVLSQAADVLERTALGIDNIKLRELYLNDVPVNRSLQQALQNLLS